MKNIITQFSRIFVGLLFIISGLIKLNDPIGFSYKLGEYFGETVLNLPFLIPLSLSLAVFLVIFEVMLGIMLILGYKTRLTLWSLLLMIVFFTFLTFYSAYFNKVTDCGCFGDALKLTPWESFTKDVVLLCLILILVWNQKRIRPIFSNTAQIGLVSISLIICVFLSYWVLNHLPIIDFRAYKVGTNIADGMRIPANAPKAVIEMTFIYEVNGQNKEFKEADLMNIPPDAKFIDRIDKVISQGYVPPIHDFSMEKDGEDHTAALLEEPKLLAFLMYDLLKSDIEGLGKLQAIASTAQKKGYKVLALTASDEQQIAAIKAKYNIDFDFYFCDATTLKTIERANPSIIIIEKGTIKQKLHFNDSEQLIF